MLNDSDFIMLAMKTAFNSSKKIRILKHYKKLSHLIFPKINKKRGIGGG